jgi:hypothetical protein
MRSTVAALSAVCFLALTSSAHAVAFDPAEQPWTFHDVMGGPPGGDWYFYPDRGETFTYLDFTLAPGSSGRIDLWIESDDPEATVYVNYPNEVFGVGTYVSGGVFDYNVGSPADLSWDEQVSPHHTVITYATSPGFDFCDALLDPADFTGFCSSSPNYWGNSDYVSVSSTASMHVFNGPPPSVPEPISWGLLLIGFFGLGEAVRRKRPLCLAVGLAIRAGT